ncbi:MAG: hypothetical protein J0H02_13580 [Armatimonadetes bacterium]|nr:hypothetical protein [Armatimonadota bacterium]
MALLSTAILALCWSDPQFVIPLAPNGQVQAGDTVGYQVVLTHACTSNQVIDLSTDNPDAFDSFPSTVTVTAGNSSAVFYATTAEDAEGSIQVSASANGKTAIGVMEILQPQDAGH